MNKIGILCACEEELEPFFAYIEGVKVIEKAMLKFYEGAIQQTDVVAVCSGVGKVNAAIATQILIDTFHVTAVINGGTAGGMAKDVGIFDTVVTKQCAYHDMDDGILTECHPWMPSVYFEGDRKLLDRVREYGKKTDKRILFGTIVTGDRFITEEGREYINRAFSPLAVDMETAGVAHACYVNGIPFLAVRTITDTEDYAGEDHFERNCEQASAISAEIIAGLIKSL